MLLVVKGQVRVVEPRQQPLVEPAHAFEEFAPDSDSVELGLHPLYWLDFGRKLSPRLFQVVLGLPEAPAPGRTAYLEIGPETVHDRAVLSGLKICGVDACRTKGLTSGEQRV
jgi:hypothetical protein